MPDDEKEFKYDFNDQEFSDTPLQVRERELKDVRDRLEKVEFEAAIKKEIAEKVKVKKSESPEEIERDVDTEVYRDLYKKERMKKYDKERQNEEIAIKKEEEKRKEKEIREKNLKKVEDSMKNGEFLNEEYKKNHPILNAIKNDYNFVKSGVLGSDIGKYVSEKKSESDDERLLKNGIPLQTIKEYNKLRGIRKIKNSWGDTDGAKENDARINEIERDIKRTTIKNKIDRKKEDVELKRMENILNPPTKFKKSPIHVNHPENLKARSQGRLANVKLLGGGKSVSIRLNGTSAQGSPSFGTNFRMPQIGGSPQRQPVSPQQALFTIRQMHAQKKYEDEYARQMAMNNNRRVEQQVEGAVVNQNRQARIRGDIPRPQMQNQLVRKPMIGLPNVSVNIKGLDIVMPRQNAGKSSTIRVPLSNNNKSVSNNPQKKIKNNPVMVNSISRISNGIGNMIQPFQASQHRAKVFGAPNCKIRDIGSNMKNISVNHHAGRDFGINMAVPKININLALNKKKKKVVK